MFHRSLNISKSNSFFLFGARGTGKSSLLQSHFKDVSHLYIDLLEERFEHRYRRSPDLLLADIKHAIKEHKIKWVVIDEVQKIPKLLDLVHKSIESININFALTGSSARKLKRGGANMLAGRAFLHYLHPLTFRELNDKFLLNDVLQWGSLPKIFSLQDETDKARFLRSYVRSYLQEEILVEQIVRNIDGFHLFLEIAAQMNGKNLNFTKLSREIGIDSKTIKEYFQILCDTLVGFWLPGFHQSLRKSQTFMPKFYFFDIGITRALLNDVESKVTPQTSTYGNLFEHYVITECFRLNDYCEKNYKLSHYQVSGGGEIDLILSKGKKHIVVEIKSSTKIDPIEVKSLARYAEPFGKDTKKYYVSLDTFAQELHGVNCIYYQDFFNQVF